MRLELVTEIRKMREDLRKAVDLSVSNMQARATEKVEPPYTGLNSTSAPSLSDTDGASKSTPGPTSAVTKIPLFGNSSTS